MGQALRRAFLCGVDHYSGQSYEHRRQWVVDRIRLLSSLFSIDVCAYAVMSNHYHLVLKLCPEQLEDVSDDQIMERWCALFKGPLLIQRYRSGEPLSSPGRDSDAAMEQKSRKLTFMIANSLVFIVFSIKVNDLIDLRIGRLP